MNVASLGMSDQRSHWLGGRRGRVGCVARRTFRELGHLKHLKKGVSGWVSGWVGGWVSGWVDG